MQSNIRHVHGCLNVTYHLRFCQNDRVLFIIWIYCGNAGMERIPKQESAQEVDPGEENYPAAAAGTRTRDLSVTSLTL